MIRYRLRPQLFALAFFCVCHSAFAQQAPQPQESATAPADSPDAPAPAPEASKNAENFAAPVGDGEVVPSPPSNTNLAELKLQTEAILKDLKDANEQADLLKTKLNAFSNPAAAAAGAAVAATADHGMAGKIWIFIAADTRAISGGDQNAIRKGATANANHVEKLLREQCSIEPRSRTPIQDKIGGVTVLTGNDFHFQALSTAINNADIKQNDVIFVYIACHGFSYRNGPLGFQMPPTPNASPERVARSTVWDKLKSKKARQTILISDSCATQIQEIATGNVGAVTAAADDNTYALSRLLFYQIGDVDINGADPEKKNGWITNGEVGIYFDDGGKFTGGLLVASRHSKPPVSWQTLLRRDAQLVLSQDFPVRVKVQGGGTRTISGQTVYLVP